VAIPHGRSYEANPRSRKGTLNARVGEHRGYHAIRSCKPARATIEGNEGDEHVSIDDRAASVNCNATIGIAVEGDAKVCALAEYLKRKRRRRCCADGIVDRAIAHCEGDHLGAGEGEGVERIGCPSTMRRIDRNAKFHWSARGNVTRRLRK
jgi:hypothetical protein